MNRADDFPMLVPDGVIQIDHEPDHLPGAWQEIQIGADTGLVRINRGFILFAKLDNGEVAPWASECEA